MGHPKRPMDFSAEVRFRFLDFKEISSVFLPKIRSQIGFSFKKSFFYWFFTQKPYFFAFSPLFSSQNPRFSAAGALRTRFFENGASDQFQAVFNQFLYWKLKFLRIFKLKHIFGPFYPMISIKND